MGRSRKKMGVEQGEEGWGKRKVRERKVRKIEA